MLSIRTERTEGKHEFGIYYTANQGRDFKTESGTASAGRWEADEGQAGTTAENECSRQAANLNGTESTVGQGPGQEEIIGHCNPRLRMLGV